MNALNSLTSFSFIAIDSWSTLVSGNRKRCRRLIVFSLGVGKKNVDKAIQILHDFKFIKRSAARWILRVYPLPLLASYAKPLSLT